ncbi:MAG: BNR-4 repeat-containing protein [Acidobacteriota bacterium]
MNDSVRALAAASCWLLIALNGATRADAAEPRVINDDGGWNWIEDPRVLLDHGVLIVGSAAAGAIEPARRGNIEVAAHDIARGTTARSALHLQLFNDGLSIYDDHNSPSLVELADGRLLAMYSAHNVAPQFYYRISLQPHDATTWGDEQQFVPSATSKVTYPGLLRLSSERRVYNFFRGLDDRFKPSYAYSDDDGRSFVTGNVFIDVPGTVRQRPYVKYAGNGRDTVHMVYTQGHPRDFDNSLFHLIYRGGKLRQSNGKPVRRLRKGLSRPSEGTRIFRGDADNVAWISDVELDQNGHPVAVYSVQKNSANLRPGQGGDDHRYRYARWTGSKWIDREIAFAGRRLYAGEDDYTGTIAIDPDDASLVYASTDVDPATGVPLISSADGQRHYEIFEGATRDGGASFTWTAVTHDSVADNIRPTMPPSDGTYRALVWLRGTYRTYSDYELSVVALAAPLGTRFGVPPLIARATPSMRPPRTD